MVTADPAILQASERHLPLSIARLGGRLKELPFLFAVLAFVVGTFLVLAQPPGQGLDEATHFNRVWTLSQGNIVVPDRNGEPGGEIPQCVTAYLERVLGEGIEWELVFVRHLLEDDLRVRRARCSPVSGRRPPTAHSPTLPHFWQSGSSAPPARPCPSSSSEAGLRPCSVSSSSSTSRYA